LSEEDLRKRYRIMLKHAWHVGRKCVHCISEEVCQTRRGEEVYVSSMEGSTSKKNGPKWRYNEGSVMLIVGNGEETGREA